jgi:hypothetical protein
MSTMTTLSIMLFDERKLTPSFGYLFNPKWVGPHESIVSMLWKFGQMNALPGHVLTTQIARNTIDPYEGVAARPSEVDMRKVQRALGVSLRVTRASLLPESLQRTGSPWSRYCRKCLSSRYHGIVHKLERVGRCPVHGCVLEVACCHCGERAPYRLNALLLGGPYRCGSCRELYVSYLLSLSSLRPPGRKACTAITRTRLNCRP